MIFNDCKVQGSIQFFVVNKAQTLYELGRIFNTKKYTERQPIVIFSLPKCDITVPNVTSDLLINPPSFNLSPVAPVASALSLKHI